MKPLERLKELSAQELASQFSTFPTREGKGFLLMCALRQGDEFYNQFEAFANDPSLLDAFDSRENYTGSRHQVLKIK